MTTGVYIWSQTASANATADSSVNYAEGQAPSSLNDSARAAMAGIAKYRDDIAGAIVTAGTSTAYTVTSYSGFDTLAHMNGQMIAFTPHATNGATVTLNVDGLGAKPLRSSPSVELPSGSLLLGTPYVATYNNSDAVWYLQGGLSNPYNVPVGGMIDWTGSTAPNSAFAMPYGQSLSRTTYASLWTFAQTEIAAGSAGRLSAAMVSTTIGSTGGTPNYQLVTGNLPPYTPTGTVPITDPGHAHFYAKGTGSTAGPGGAGSLYQSDTTGTTQSSGTGISANFNGTPQGGASAAFNLVQPTIIVPKILRVI